MKVDNKTSSDFLPSFIIHDSIMATFADTPT